MMQREASRRFQGLERSNNRLRDSELCEKTAYRNAVISCPGMVRNDYGRGAYPEADDCYMRSNTANPELAP
jgi:hypothetical protein